MTDIYKELDEEITVLGGIDKVLELDVAAMNRIVELDIAAMNRSALKHVACVESADAEKMFNSDEFQKLIEEGQRIRAELAASKQPSGLQGWVCPVCGAGLSPFTSVCPCRPMPVPKITC